MIDCRQPGNHQRMGPTTRVPAAVPARRRALSITSVVISGIHIVMTPVSLNVFGLSSLVCLGLGVVAFRRTRDSTSSDRSLGEVALYTGVAALACAAVWGGVALLVSGPAVWTGS